MRRALAAAGLVFAVSVALAQPRALPSFEAADAKAHRRTTAATPQASDGSPRNGRYDMRSSLG